MKIKTSLVIIIIGLLPLVMVLGNSMLIPILPLIEKDLNITSFEVGLLLSIFSIVAAIVIPIVGFLSDRFGRKKLVLFSLIFVMLGSILAIKSGSGVEQSYRWMMAGRILQGIGAGGTAPLAMALVGDLFEGSERSKSLGALEVFNGIGKVISPFIGAVAAVFFWYSAFYFYFLVALVAFVGISFSIKTINEEKNSDTLTEYRKMLVKVLKKEARWIIPLSFLGAVGLFLLFGLLVYLSFEIERIFHINGIFKGIVFMIPLGAMTVVSYWTGKNIKSNHQYMKQLLLLGSLILSGVLVFFIFYHFFQALVFGLTIAAAGLGFILPCINTLITSSVSGKERGMIVSLYSVVRFLGVAFGPIFFSIWMEEVVSMFVKAAILMIVSSLWMIFALRLKVSRKELTSRAFR